MGLTPKLPCSGSWSSGQSGPQPWPQPWAPQQHLAPLLTESGLDGTCIVLPPVRATQPVEDPNTFRSIQNWGGSFLEEELQMSAERPLQVMSLLNGLLVMVNVSAGSSL